MIVGAGPTGLNLALWLTRLGVKVRIIDKAAEPGTVPRGRSRCMRAPWNSTIRWILPARSSIAGSGGSRHIMGRGRSFASAHRVWRYGTGRDLPYALIFPQDEHERLLIDHLGTAGVAVEQPWELSCVRGAGRAGGHTPEAAGRIEEEITTAAFIAGCDGTRSIVRLTLKVVSPAAPIRISSMSRMLRQAAAP